MKIFFKILSLAVSLFSVSLFSPATYAVIIEGNIRGVISELYNGSVDPFVRPVWKNVSLGDEVYGSFWYDTDKAPYKLPSRNDLYYYTGSDVWMSSSFTIGGKTYSSSDYAKYNGNLSTESLYLTSLESVPDGSSRESFYLADIIGMGDYSADFTTMIFLVQLVSQELPLLDGLSLVQSFDWYAGDPSSDALADFYIGSSRNGKQTASSAEIDVREFHIGIKKSTQLPEPSPLILLGISLALLGTKAGRVFSN